MKVRKPLTYGSLKAKVRREWLTPLPVDDPLILEIREQVAKMLQARQAAQPIVNDNLMSGETYNG